MRISGTELIEIYNNPRRRKKFESLLFPECPVCHRNYESDEPLRIIVESASNQMMAREECYWEWVGGDIKTRYFSRIEETPAGFCYVRELDKPKPS